MAVLSFLGQGGVGHGLHPPTDISFSGTIVFRHYRLKIVAVSDTLETEFYGKRRRREGCGVMTA